MAEGVDILHNILDLGGRQLTDSSEPGHVGNVVGLWVSGADTEIQRVLDIRQFA